MKHESQPVIVGKLEKNKNDDIYFANDPTGGLYHPQKYNKDPLYDEMA